MTKQKAQNVHARQLDRFYTVAAVELDNEHGRGWRNDRATLEPMLSKNLRQQGDFVARNAQVSDVATLDHLDASQHLMAGIMRVSVGAQALRLAMMMDQVGYDQNALPQDRWDALVKCAVHLLKAADWPPVEEPINERDDDEIQP